ncbi:hypothetical protein IQ238_04385 [Pleurocapsales cyanobacterium LEGE 06147]|nr:hypothetical protein [Pleurocapsales cyanobacterium LEGE 06147]
MVGVNGQFGTHRAQLCETFGLQTEKIGASGTLAKILGKIVAWLENYLGVFVSYQASLGYIWA